MVCATYIAYKINSKLVKAANQHVFSLGIPQSVVLRNGLIYQNKELLKIEETQNFILYQINHSINEIAYINWCTKVLELNKTIIKQNAKPNENNNQLIVTYYKFTTNHSPNHNRAIKCTCGARN